MEKPGELAGPGRLGPEAKGSATLLLLSPPVLIFCSPRILSIQFDLVRYCIKTLFIPIAEFLVPLDILGLFISLVQALVGQKAAQ